MALAATPHSGFVVEGITRMGEARFLGRVGIHDTQPSYHLMYWGRLSDTSRFRLLRLEPLAEGAAIVFHQFDESKYNDHPVEHFSGWVAPELCDDAVAWIDELNTHTSPHCCAIDATWRMVRQSARLQAWRLRPKD